MTFWYAAEVCAVQQHDLVDRHQIENSTEIWWMGKISYRNETSRIWQQSSEFDYWKMSSDEENEERNQLLARLI